MKHGGTEGDVLERHGPTAGVFGRHCLTLGIRFRVFVAPCTSFFPKIIPRAKRRLTHVERTSDALGNDTDGVRGATKA